MKDKRSFFERLTGSIRADEDMDTEPAPVAAKGKVSARERERALPAEEEAVGEEGELTVDVYQTPDDVVIKTIVAGVRPEDLDIAITRDMVTIKGARQEAREVTEGDYFHRELYWGSFSRTILLPQEVDVEGADAGERYGLLTIKLPKLDKSRQTKLKVKSS